MGKNDSSGNTVIEVFPTKAQLWFFLIVSIVAFLGLIAFEYTMQGKTAAEERRRTQASLYVNPTTLSMLAQYESEIPVGIAIETSAPAADDNAGEFYETEDAAAKARSTIELSNSKKLAEIYPAAGADGQKFIRTAASDWKLSRLLNHLDSAAAQALVRDLISDAEPRSVPEE